MLTGRILSKVTIMSKQKYTDSNGKRQTGSAYVRLPNSRALRGEAKQMRAERDGAVCGRSYKAE